MNWKHNLSHYVFNKAGSFFKHKRNGLRVLAYHSIGGSAHRDNIDLYSVSPRMFEDQIKSLSEYNDIRLTKVKNEKIDDSSLKIAFSFDDGYLDNLQYVAPLMEKYKYPWHIYVVSDFIKNNKKSFLSPSDLRELSSYKFVTIGSHGKSHTALPDCDASNLKSELFDSKNYLEDLLGKKIDSLSYPFGLTNKSVIIVAKEAGYNIACSSYFNINHSNRNMMCLCRTPIFSYDNVKTFLQKTFGMWDWMKYFTHDPVTRE